MFKKALPAVAITERECANSKFPAISNCGTKHDKVFCISESYFFIMLDISRTFSFVNPCLIIGLNWFTICLASEFAMPPCLAKYPHFSANVLTFFLFQKVEIKEKILCSVCSFEDLLDEGEEAPPQTLVSVSFLEADLTKSLGSLATSERVNVHN